MPTEIHPFSNGSQFADWCEMNSGNCKKASEDWNGIEGERTAWVANPWVWVIQYRRVHPLAAPGGAK